MADHVYANGREIACKKAAGKSICAFPDVCMTPPENPATPPGVPIPYPNTGFAKDTTGGSKKVMITGKEVMLKNKSYFKTSVGDEAGCAAKKGVITSKNKGKVYFRMWSPNVKIEGANVVRHLDLTTHNHMCDPANEACPWPYTDRMAMANATSDCDDEVAAADEACEKGKGGDFKCPKRGTKSANEYSMDVESNKCQRALRCMLSPKKPSKCCGNQTPHHLVPAASFKPDADWGAGKTKYNAAPCICAEGHNGTSGTHGLIHAAQKKAVKDKFPNMGPKEIGKQTQKFEDAVSQGGAAAAEVFPQCSQKCIESQLRQEHEKLDVKNNPDVRPVAHGPKDISAFKAVFQALQNTFKIASGTLA